MLETSVAYPFAVMGEALYVEALAFDKAGNQPACTARLEMAMRLQLQAADETECWRDLTRKEG